MRAGSVHFIHRSKEFQFELKRNEAAATAAAVENKREKDGDECAKRVYEKGKNVAERQHRGSRSPSRRFKYAIFSFFSFSTHLFSLFIYIFSLFFFVILSVARDLLVRLCLCRSYIFRNEPSLRGTTMYNNLPECNR